MTLASNGFFAAFSGFDCNFIGFAKTLYFNLLLSFFPQSRFLLYLCPNLTTPAMSNYIVSARKYRPMTFDSVVGQQSLTTTLKNAIASGKLAHAYLFCGPRGVGKTTCARIFAKTINCQHPTTTGDACNECESCAAFNEQRSYNIHELDAASNNSVEDIRSLIEQVRIPPQVGRYKVFIIDEVHMLSTAAFNAFLKTLEEPPAHAIFILATTEKHKILPTILSRCQIYDFNRMEVDGIVGHLKRVAENEGYEYEEAALNVIARKADGGMRDALSIFDQVANFTGGKITYRKVIEDLNVLDYDYYFDLTDSLLKRDITGALLLLNEILGKGFEANHFMGGLAAHFRDLLVSRDPVTLPLLEAAESVRQRYQEQASRCKPAFLYKALRLCNDCDQNYRTSRNKRLLVELTLIEVAQLTEEDAPGQGLGPAKKTLKPIFTAETARPEAAKTATTEVPAVVKKSEPAVVKGTILSEQPATYHVKAQKNRPHTISIKNKQAAAEPKESVSDAKEDTAGRETTVSGNKPYEESDVRYAWNCFAARLPQEQKAMAVRMKAIKPDLREGGLVEVIVENQQVYGYMQPLLRDIETAIRKQLDNGNIQLAIRIREQKGQSRALGRREQFIEMTKKSSPLATLCRALSLELV